MDLLKCVFADKRRQMYLIKEKAAADPRFDALWQGLLLLKKTEKEAARTLRRSLDYLKL
jgi:hypothetical protein